jgi:hypothetical protein
MSPMLHKTVSCFDVINSNPIGKENDNHFASNLIKMQCVEKKSVFRVDGAEV